MIFGELFENFQKDLKNIIWVSNHLGDGRLGDLNKE